MLLHEICPGSVAEIELIGSVQYVYDCIYSKGIEDNEYSLGLFKSLYTSIPNGTVELVNVNVTNNEDNKVYYYPNSAIINVKRDIITVGSVFNIDYKKVRQSKRHRYDTIGILIHNGLSTPIHIIDISGNGVGFKISNVSMNIGDTVYIKFISQEDNLIFEKVKIARIAKVSDGFIIGCRTIKDIVKASNIMNILNK